MLITAQLARPILGKTFLDRLTEPVLEIGTEKISRDDLVRRFETGNFRAARIVSIYCKQNGIKSLDDLYRKTSPYELAGTEGFGETALFVLLELFKANGLDIRKWYRLPDDETGKQVITFASMSHRAEADEVFKQMKKRERKANARSRRSGAAHRDRKRHVTHEAAVAATLAEAADRT